MKKLTIAGLAISLLFSSLADAASINLGQAAEYNAFIQRDMKVSSADTQGKIAVGGNFIVKPHAYTSTPQGFSDSPTLEASYTVGDMVHAPSVNSLVVGGNIELHQLGGLQIHNTGIDHGKAVYAGKLINGNQIGSGTAKNVATAALPVDFNAAFAHLNNLSNQLAAMTTPATTTHNGVGTPLVFTPAAKSADKVYVFDISQEMLDKYDGLEVKGVESDALVVFNITNKSGYTFQRLSDSNTNAQGKAFCTKGDKTCAVLKLESVKINGVSTTGDTSKDRNAVPLAKQVLFNFNGLSNVKLASRVNGTVLAPKTALVAPSAPVWGQVIAQSWIGNAQINLAPLKPVNGTPPAVSTPPAWSLLLLALLLLLVLPRQRQTTPPKPVFA
jgi:choice-of-anchor A domain-containing protein